MGKILVEGRSGTFFNPGDAAALTNAIAPVVQGDVPVPTRRTVMDAAPRTTFPQFLESVERAYAEAQS